MKQRKFNCIHTSWACVLATGLWNWAYTSWIHSKLQNNNASTYCQQADTFSLKNTDKEHDDVDKALTTID